MRPHKLFQVIRIELLPSLMYELMGEAEVFKELPLLYTATYLAFTRSVYRNKPSKLQLMSVNNVHWQEASGVVYERVNITAPLPIILIIIYVL